MKTYKCIVRTSFYQTIEIEAEGYAQAKSAAWDYLADNDPTKFTDIDSDVYDIEEMGQAPKLLASEG